MRSPAMADRVRHQRVTFGRWGDLYEGTKSDLIAAGLARAEWFPANLQPEFCRDGSPKLRKGKQRVRRTYHVEGRKPEIMLIHLPYRDGWILQIAVSDGEKRRREAAEKAAANDLRRQVEEELRLAGIFQRENAERDGDHERNFEVLRQLPQFESGSMSEGEKYAMRLFRALTDRSWDFIVDWAEITLTNPATEDHKALALEKPPHQHLKLVVDNEVHRG